MAEAGTHDTDRVIDEIGAERKRQGWDEGWTPEHDDKHDRGEMARAAAAYAYPTPRLGDECWPWDFKWFKRTTRRRDLVKAGALIVAEIERLDRATVARMAEKLNT